MVNLAVLDDAIEWAKTSNQYNQGYWAMKNECGTSFCIAGRILQQAGWKPIWGATVSNMEIAYGFSLDGEEDSDNPGETAAKYLEVDKYYLIIIIMDMFDEFNTLDEVIECANILVGYERYSLTASPVDKDPALVVE